MTFTDYTQTLDVATVNAMLEALDGASKPRGSAFAEPPDLDLDLE